LGLDDLQAHKTALSIGRISLGFTRLGETTKVSFKDIYRIRRIYRRLAKIRGRGHLHRLTVFVRYENVLRLLEFLGYPVE
jgi:hypothetical protein